MGIETLAARKSEYLRAACGTVRRALEAITTLNGLRGCTTGRAIFLRAMPPRSTIRKTKIIDEDLELLEFRACLAFYCAMCSVMTETECAGRSSLKSGPTVSARSST